MEPIVEDAFLAEVERALFTSGAEKAEPSTYRQAMKRPDADEWQKAAEEEMEAHARNRTWDIVPLPEGCKAIGSRWVFKVKHNTDGSVERYKARLVAKGFSQRPGFDYFETFAPTAKFAAIRAILALSALEDFHLRSVDISHAFINGDLDTVVYMEQSEGFEQGGP